MTLTDNCSPNPNRQTPKGDRLMPRPTRPRLRTLTLTLALGALLTLFGASAGYAQPAPEACNPDPADEVSSSLVTLDDGTTRQDHLALFDVYWDYDDDALDPNSKTLINNPCPPMVVHHPAHEDERGDLIPESTTRRPSDVDIGHTIIHIPSAELQQPAERDAPAVQSFKRRVTASGTGDYDGAGTKFHWSRHIPNGGSGLFWDNPTTDSPQLETSYQFADETQYQVRAVYVDPNDGVTKTVESDWVTVAWQ